MSATLHFGTQGWAYPDWIGVFYPPGAKQEDYLPFYCAGVRHRGTRHHVLSPAARRHRALVGEARALELPFRRQSAARHHA